MHVNKRICLPALALSIAASMMIMRAAMASKAMETPITGPGLPTASRVSASASRRQAVGRRSRSRCEPTGTIEASARPR